MSDEKMLDVGSTLKTKTCLKVNVHPALHHDHHVNAATSKQRIKPFNLKRYRCYFPPQTPIIHLPANVYNLSVIAVDYPRTY